MYPNPKFNFGFNATISKLVVVLNEKLKLEICFHNFWSFFSKSDTNGVLYCTNYMKKTFPEKLFF